MSDLTQRLGVMTKALGLRAERQQVLASNIANADTPHYKARDFDFSQAMAGAMAGREGLALARTSGRHLAAAADFGQAALQYRKETQSAVDGNTVDMDVERAQMAENSLQYEILTRMISDRIQGMRTALSPNQG